MLSVPLVQIQQKIHRSGLKFVILPGRSFPEDIIGIIIMLTVMQLIMRGDMRGVVSL